MEEAAGLTGKTWKTGFHPGMHLCWFAPELGWKHVLEKSACPQPPLCTPQPQQANTPALLTPSRTATSREKTPLWDTGVTWSWMECVCVGGCSGSLPLLSQLTHQKKPRSLTAATKTVHPQYMLSLYGPCLPCVVTPQPWDLGRWRLGVVEFRGSDWL